MISVRQGRGEEAYLADEEKKSSKANLGLGHRQDSSDSKSIIFLPHKEDPKMQRDLGGG